MKANIKSLLQVHFAVFLLGFSGLFGKLTTVSIFTLILGRSVFSFLSLGSFLNFQKKSIAVENKKDLYFLFSLGAILALHWLTFFYSIKLSTVAIGLLTFSTFPIFVTFLEPLFFKEKLLLKNIFIAFLAFVGVTFVIPNFDISNSDTVGAFWGIVSGFVYALFAIGNRKVVKKYSSLIVSLYEQLSVVMILAPYYLLVAKETVPFREVILIALLGIIFTAFAHTLAIEALKNIKAQTSSVIFCLEPFYAIILASILLDEIPSPKTLIGGVIILGTVLFSNFINKD
ncbi:DMT family transporter [Fusobacterium sp.]|uniref:DMT family transporter n=1 Tax=Fusobacterium sp. TaxID=68766 RepID=UPI00261B81E5|nr:DMT family transporter [Fusobacterium sp.]